MPALVDRIGAHGLTPWRVCYSAGAHFCGKPQCPQKCKELRLVDQMRSSMARRVMTLLSQAQKNAAPAHRFPCNGPKKPVYGDNFKAALWCGRRSRRPVSKAI